MFMGGGDLEFTLEGTASAHNGETLTKGSDRRNRDLRRRRRRYQEYHGVI
jgi:hypothetical protein